MNKNENKKSNIVKIHIGGNFVGEVSKPFEEKGYSAKFRICESELFNITFENSNYPETDFDTLEQARNTICNEIRQFIEKISPFLD